VARIAGQPCLPDALVRLRATAALGEKSAAERTVEVAGAFAVRRSREARLRGSHVLLVDDVMTSGATANACAAVLLAAGAASVDVLAAARVPDPRLN
jgi:predicted amidophosphoribosyltransferase